MDISGCSVNFALNYICQKIKTIHWMNTYFQHWFTVWSEHSECKTEVVIQRWAVWPFTTWGHKCQIYPLSRLHYCSFSNGNLRCYSPKSVWKQRQHSLIHILITPVCTRYSRMRWQSLSCAQYRLDNQSWLHSGYIYICGAW